MYCFDFQVYLSLERRCPRTLFHVRFGQQLDSISRARSPAALNG
jgi:hypothetical protein